jgi:hypothetical protein
MSEHEPPDGLGASGQQLWNAVTTPYVLMPTEVTILVECCRTADELDRLERAVRELPELTTRGSTGQLRPHPLLNEVRAHRQLLERLTEALNLPDDTQLIGDRAGSRRTRAATRARWNRQNREIS